MKHSYSRARHLRMAIPLTVVALSLSACGGGGGDTSTISTGYFLDSAVGGITYATASQSGTTGADGSFNYVTGENVTFSVGAIELPSVAASSQITPLDIAGTTNTDDSEVVNMLVFLQSIDSDGDPSNGITVPNEAAANATTALDFTKTTTEFSAQAAFTDLVATIPSATLKTAASAKAHFAQTVSVKNIPVAPVANAGDDQTVTLGDTVTLEGSASSDANGDQLTYSWSLTSIPTGSVTTLSDPTSIKPTFIADAGPSYVASLTVSDGTSTSTVDSVTIGVGVNGWLSGTFSSVPATSANTEIANGLAFLLANNPGIATAEYSATATALAASNTVTASAKVAEDNLQAALALPVEGESVSTSICAATTSCTPQEIIDLRYNLATIGTTAANAVQTAVDAIKNYSVVALAAGGSLTASANAKIALAEIAVDGTRSCAQGATDEYNFYSNREGITATMAP